MGKAREFLNKFGEATPYRVMDVPFTVKKEGGGFIFKIPGHGESGKVYPTEGAARIAATEVIRGMKKK